MNLKNWVCPYCKHAQTIISDRYHAGNYEIYVKGYKDGDLELCAESVVCANEDCKELVLKVSVNTFYWGVGRKIDKSVLGFWNLLPQSGAKPQPDYIPEPIRNDYYEACSIRDLSSKAAATLTRRCLQGMIRDFFGIAKGTLNAEIDELRNQVSKKESAEIISLDVLDAIDHVRKIGNIGAHMEKDINIVVEVDPDEVQILIELIETLFDEWYVAREQKRQRLARLKQIADEKEASRRIPAPALQLPSPETISGI
jgi:hypothetical protein